MKTAIYALLFFICFVILGALIFNFIILPFWTGFHQEVDVPDVCGKSYEEAKKIIEECGLKAEIYARTYSNIPENIVISQEPSPTRKVKKGRVIKLSISMGVEKVKVPWVQGFSLEQASRIIADAGLIVNEVRYEYSNTIPKEQVIGTVPQNDEVVKKGTKVDIIVSKGSYSILLPNFCWKTLKDAMKEISSLNLFTKVKYIAKPSSLGIVIDQVPSPGQEVFQEDTILLIVGSPRR